MFLCPHSQMFGASHRASNVSKVIFVFRTRRSELRLRVQKPINKEPPRITVGEIFAKTNI